MKTLGEILKKTREEKGISLEEVEKATKIRREFLKALEENNFDFLPSFTYTSGFVKNYAKFLDLPEDEVLAIFRRDYQKLSLKAVSLEKPKFKESFLEISKLPILILGILVFLGVGIFLGYQYFSLKKPPSVKIYSPRFEEKTSEEKIEIKGKTNPEVLLKINGVPVIVSFNGEFSFWVDLFPGENKILIEAENKEGKKSKLEWIIFRLDKEK